MPRVPVAWYDLEDEEAGYHVCRNCKISRKIDSTDLEITSEDEARKRREPCPKCEIHQMPHSQRPRRMPRCDGITVPTR